MKYKAKFNLASKYYRKDYKMSCTDTILKEGEYNSEDFGSDQGVFVFIPFTDQRFFEPIKTRTFQVEVSEDDIEHFNYIKQDFNWTIIEITEPSWITDYKSSGSYNTDAFSINDLYTIDVEEFKDNYQYGKGLQGVKWIKDRFGKGLKESKELADFIFALSV